MASLHAIRIKRPSAFSTVHIYFPTAIMFTIINKIIYVLDLGFFFIVRDISRYLPYLIQGLVIEFDILLVTSMVFYKKKAYILHDED